MFTAPTDSLAEHRTYAGHVLIIGNSSSSPKELTTKKLRDIFWGRDRKWENGTPIRVFVLPSSNPMTLEFFTQYLGVLPSTYWSNILKQSGDDVYLPTVSPTEAALYHSVDCTPGSIGYISDSEYEYHENENDMVDSMGVTH